MQLAVYNIIKYNIKYTHIMREDKPHMLTFKSFTTLLNITLNKPTLCVKTSQICCLSMRDYVDPYAINRLCLSMRNVRDYYPPKDHHRVATDYHVKSFFFTKQSSQCILYGFREGSPLHVVSQVEDVKP